MKLSNSLKYMNAFPPSAPSHLPSRRRFGELCQRLGRIEIGARYICIPSGGAGYATAVMLESVMTAAGHTVGRISSAHGFNSRLSVTVCGNIPSIEDYNNSVEALKHAVRRDPDARYVREEVTLALSLLLCRMCGCQYVILQGIGSLDAICAPYELILLPTVYEKEGGVQMITSACESVRRGAREVVSGNQRGEIYRVISNACAMSGIRLDIPVKSQFSVTEVTARSLSFTYGDREGFTMRSPSKLLCDSAMAVIEAALALRRGGVKLPWSSIQEGIGRAANTGCFELLSVSPLLILDSASDPSSAELLLETFGSVFSESATNELSLCLPDSARDALKVFEKMNIEELIILCGKPSVESAPDATAADESAAIDGETVEGGAVETVCDSVKRCAKEVVRLMKRGKSLICFGSVSFAYELRIEILKILNG